MTKRSCSHEEGEELRGFVHFLKKSNDDEEGDNDYCYSCLLHKEKTKGSKTTAGKH